MKDPSWKSFAKADQLARNKSWQKGQVATSEMVYQLPPDPVKGQTSFKATFTDTASFDLNALRPAGINHFYILGPCADTSRDVATQISRPITGMELGRRVGDVASQQAKVRTLEALEKLSIYGQEKDAAITADLGEMLNGIRTKKRSKR